MLHVGGLPISIGDAGPQSLIKGLYSLLAVIGMKAQAHQLLN
jgi:hypothetical protein